MRNIAATALGLATLLLVATPSIAYAASYLDEAVQALQTSNVYVSPEVRTIDAATKAKLEEQTTGTSIAVVVLPSNAGTEAGDISQFVSDVGNQSGRQTVVVAFGNDLEAKSGALPGGEASKIANEAEHANTSVGAALTDFVTEVRSETTPSTSPDSGGFDGGLLWLSIAVVALLTGGLGAGYAWLKSRKRQTTQVNKDYELAEAATPTEIRDLLAAIDEFTLDDEEMARTLRQASFDTMELFKRLRRNKSSEIHQTTAHYKGLLQTVRKMLVTYTDIQKNPRYYEPNTGIYLRDGKAAAGQYAAGVLKNIQEVESGTLTDFRVDIKMLASANPSDDPTIR